MKKIFLILSASLLILTCDDIIEVEDISNEIVILLAPTNEATLNTSSLNFNWESIEDAETYHIQIATPNFNQAQQIVNDSIVNTLNFSTTLDPNIYQWRVRGENSAYQTSYTIQNFSIEN